MASRFEAEFNTRVMPMAERVFGATVCLARGVLVTDEFTARRNEFEISAMGVSIGVSSRVERRDYLLPIASVAFEGDLVQPRTGDQVIEGEEIWKVFSPDDSTPASERVAGGYDWIVRTKRVQ